MNAAEALMERGRQEGERRGLLKGRQEGLQEGEKHGIAKGRAETLIQLMTLRFETLHPDVLARIEKASEHELTAWTARVLRAESIAEIFS